MNISIYQNDNDSMILFNEDTGVQIVITDNFIQYFTVTDDSVKTDILKIKYEKSPEK